MSFMAGSTGGQVNNSLTALMSAIDATGTQLIVDSMTARDVELQIIADASATTAYTLPALVTRQNYRVRVAYYIVTSAVTANASNYATVTLSYVTAAGGSSVTLGSLNTSTTSLVANAQNALTLVTTAIIIPAGSTIIAATSKTGTGVSLAPGAVIFTLDIV